MSHATNTRRESCGLIVGKNCAPPPPGPRMRQPLPSAAMTSAAAITRPVRIRRIVRSRKIMPSSCSENVLNETGAPPDTAAVDVRAAMRYGSNPEPPDDDTTLPLYRAWFASGRASRRQGSHHAGGRSVAPGVARGAERARVRHAECAAGCAGGVHLRGGGLPEDE